MLSAWKTLKNIFSQYSKLLLKVSTFIACLFIYFLGISLGHFFYNFSLKPNHRHWQKFSNNSPPEAMY